VTTDNEPIGVQMLKGTGFRPVWVKANISHRSGFARFVIENHEVPTGEVRDERWSRVGKGLWRYPK